MTYTEYMNKVKDIALYEDNGTWYLMPNYLYLIHQNKLDLGYYVDPEDIADMPNITMQQVKEELRLEVAMRNKKNDHTKQVVDWIYELLTVTIDPKITEEQNEFIKNVMNYMQYNDQLKDKEKALEEKSKIVDFAPGMSFKKGL